MKYSTSTSMFMRDKVKSEYYYIEHPLSRCGCDRNGKMERTSEEVWRYKIEGKRMCALSQLKSCQGPGTYKLQATDKRQICLSSCFPLHLSGLLFLLLSFLFFCLPHHRTSINEGNCKVVCSGILTL